MGPLCQGASSSRIRLSWIITLLGADSLRNHKKMESSRKYHSGNSESGVPNLPVPTADQVRMPSTPGLKGRGWSISVSKNPARTTLPRAYNSNWNSRKMLLVPHSFRGLA